MLQYSIGDVCIAMAVCERESSDSKSTAGIFDIWKDEKVTSSTDGMEEYELSVMLVEKQSVVGSAAKESSVGSVVKELATDRSERWMLSAGATKLETLLMNSYKGAGLHFTHCQSISTPSLTAVLYCL